MAVEVIQGEDKKLVIKLRDSAGDPFDLTPYVGGAPDDIVFCVKKSDDSKLELKLSTSGVTVLSAVLGKIQVDISDTDTAALASGPLGFEIELIMNTGADKDIVQFVDALSVVERVC